MIEFYCAGCDATDGEVRASHPLPVCAHCGSTGVTLTMTISLNEAHDTTYHRIDEEPE